MISSKGGQVTTPSSDRATVAHPHWYRRRTGFFGRKPIQFTAGAIYAIVALYPLLHSAICQRLPAWTHGRYAIDWALVVTLGYPTWAWLETIAFNRWVYDEPLTEQARLREQAYFNAMSDRAAKFWQAVIAAYAAAALLGLKL